MSEELRQHRMDCSIVFLLPKLVCDALDRASPDTERLGYPQDTDTLRKLVSNLPLGRDVDLRPPALHALGDGALELCFYSLANHRPLKLGENAPVTWKTSLPIGVVVSM